MNYRNGLDEKIANILEEACPAFVRLKGTGGSVWHKCHCRAQKPYTLENLQSCDCVWHLTNHCCAGTWPQLSFIAEQLEKANIESSEWLIKAKQAIVKEGD